MEKFSSHQRPPKRNSGDAARMLAIYSSAWTRYCVDRQADLSGRRGKGPFGDGQATRSRRAYGTNCRPARGMPPEALQGWPKAAAA
jgi:hypothetical protein